MALGPMTRKWLIVILLATAVVLLAVWLYTAYAAEEVEPEVGDQAALTFDAGPVRAAAG